MTNKNVLWIVATLLLLAGTNAANAQSKQQAYQEMISISQQINALKGNPAEAAEVEELRARYAELSASLGGDDPGALIDAPAAPAPGGAGASVVPPNCASTVSNAASTDTPQPINDNATTTSTITVAGAGAYLQDLNITTDISHTFPGDLDITVTSPAGTVVTLTTDNGGGSDNVFAGTVWDDDAGDSNPPGAVTDNTYADLVVETPLVAEEALAAFIGENPNGVWQIDIFDDADLDQGTLNSWSVSVTTLDMAPVFNTPVSGTSTDTPLPINDMTNTMSTLSIAGADVFACAVELTTDITHTFASDLEITVTSPAGTVVTVTTDNGGGNDNVFAGTIWDDYAGSTNPPGPVSDNTYADLVVETPLVVEEALGAFIGEDTNGTWQIDVFDDAGMDTGSLNSWSVAATTCACAVDALATFAVNKDFDDNNPADVEVNISCNTGLPLQQTTTISQGDGVVFVVTDFNEGEMDCEITESETAGYVADYFDGSVNSADSCVHSDITFGQASTCTITNSLQPVDVEVTKEWIDDNPQFNAVNYAEATYSCSGAQFSNPFGQLEFYGNPASDGFSVYPHWNGNTQCDVTESLVESGVEADDADCQNLVVTPGNGASCTIFNTRLYEGIPTLSRYSLLLLAMLMLGLGLVAYRRLI